MEKWRNANAPTEEEFGRWTQKESVRAGEFIKETMDAAGEMLIKAKRFLRMYGKGAKR